MFYYLEGKVALIEQNTAVIDIGGVGYNCYTSMNTLSCLTVGGMARLYTYCNIREDAFDIYGFHDINEKRCFEMLLSVSGVGPKAAISILSSATPEQVALAVVTDDTAPFTAAQGIGKRIAQRIILELKDKIAKDGFVISKPQMSDQNTMTVGKKLSEISAALAVLGYSNAEITMHLKGIDVDGSSVEEVIRQVLKGSAK